MTQEKNDMLHGPITRPLLRFALPVFLGNLFQQLYSLVDTVIVGKTLGTMALAGVGSTTGLSFLAVSLCNGLCNGLAVSTSQRYGAGDHKGLRACFGNAAFLSILLFSALTVAFTLLCRPVLLLTRTPDEIYRDAYRYILVILFGLPCTAFYNFLASHLRAIGNSRTPVIALVISAGINIVLDLVFILRLHWGTAGAAAATVIAQLFSGTYLLWHMFRHEALFRLTRQELHLSRTISANQLATALPMALQSVVITVGILIVQTVTNGMGALYVAGSTAGNKLYGVMSAPIDAVCQSVIPFAGQNYGAGNMARIHKGLLRVMAITWSLTILLSLLAWFFGPAMMRLFISPAQEDVIRYGHQFLLFFVMGFGFLSIQLAFCFALQGTGFARYTILSGVLETLGRIAGAVLLTRWIGYTGVCLALPLAWVFTSAYLIPVYIHFRKHWKETMG